MDSRSCSEHTFAFGELSNCTTTALLVSPLVGRVRKSVSVLARLTGDFFSSMADVLAFDSVLAVFLATGVLTFAGAAFAGVAFGFFVGVSTMPSSLSIEVIGLAVDLLSAVFCTTWLATAS